MLSLTLASPGEYAAFIRWFSAAIGTEYETNNNLDGTYTVTMFELTDREAAYIMSKWG